jgi:hypothetical protein
MLAIFVQMKPVPITVGFRKSSQNRTLKSMVSRLGGYSVFNVGPAVKRLQPPKEPPSTGGGQIPKRY